jgi:hypothetical protein
MRPQKVHDIHRRFGESAMTPYQARRRTVGVINPRTSRLWAFIVMSVALVLCALVCLLATWNLVGPDYAWRAAVSLFIVAGAAALFLALNEGFGPAVHGEVPPWADRRDDATLPPVLPAETRDAGETPADPAPHPAETTDGEPRP